MALPSDHIPLLARFELSAAHPAAGAARFATPAAAAAAAGDARASLGGGAAVDHPAAATQTPLTAGCSADGSSSDGRLGGGGDEADTQPAMEDGQPLQAPRFCGIGTVL